MTDLTWPTPQPIETAPRGGSYVLAFVPPQKYGRYVEPSRWAIMSFDDEYREWRDDDGQLYFPTCWLPLPPNPEANSPETSA